MLFSARPAAWSRLRASSKPTFRVTKSKPCIAVVDDKLLVRNSLRRLLLAADYDAVVFASGDEFLQSLADQSPDCVLVDLNMPGLSGLDVVLRLKAHRTDMPVIIMTEGGSPNPEQEVADAGARELKKPFFKDEFYTAIESALRSRDSAPQS